MRLLSLNIDSKLTQQLEEDELYICDITEDIDDAVYHAQVRFYNLVLIKEDSLIRCKELLRVVNAKYSAFVVITKNADKEFEIELLKSGAIFVIREPIHEDLLMARLESIHRENFAGRFYFNGCIGIDRRSKSVIDPDEKELNIRGKAYEILSYLLKNRNRPPISKDEIIDAIWDEPELICQNIVEVNINQIRNELRKRFNYEFVATIRNRGYRINI